MLPAPCAHCALLLHTLQALGDTRVAGEWTSVPSAPVTGLSEVRARGPRPPRSAPPMPERPVEVRAARGQRAGGGTGGRSRSTLSTPWPAQSRGASPTPVLLPPGRRTRHRDLVRSGLAGSGEIGGWAADTVASHDGVLSPRHTSHDVMLSPPMTACCHLLQWRAVTSYNAMLSPPMTTCSLHILPPRHVAPMGTSSQWLVLWPGIAERKPAACPPGVWLGRGWRRQSRGAREGERAPWFGLESKWGKK